MIHRPLSKLAAIVILTTLVAACSKPTPAVPVTAADTATPLPIENMAVPAALPAPSVPAEVVVAAPAAAFVPIKVPVEDTQEPASLDAARLPNGAALTKSAAHKK